MFTSISFVVDYAKKDYSLRAFINNESLPIYPF